MPKGSRANADDTLVAYLAQGLAIEDAARKAGVSRATAFRRLQDETFKRRVREAKSAELARAQAVLSTIAVSAAVTLGKLLTSSSEKIRLGASRVALEQAVRFRDAVSLEERISVLEDAAAAREKR
jgi:hypothetical protein